MTSARARAEAAVNVDHDEVAKFEELAARWWDPEGAFRPLHELNPVRLRFVDDATPVAGQRVVDVGCGGGILTEAMARLGAEVTGIDAARAPISVARLHAKDSGLDIDYRQATAESLAAEHPASYGVVTCMELLEHVPDPRATVTACAELARPGASVYFSTINRTPAAWLLAIVGAEYVAELLPRGTHTYARFIRPSELEAWCRSAGLTLRALSGLHYNPIRRSARLDANVDVNYIARCTRDDG